jgi:hypothetical protein
MSGWTKLFSSIVTSSVWCESHTTVRVWVAMLAQADADGVVEGSVPGFANLAHVTVDEMRAAVATLSSPDPDSRTPDNEGRRIERIEGGWRVLNYARYRQRAQEKEGSKAPAMRAYRARRKAEQEQAAAGNALPPEVTSYPEERRERRDTDNGLRKTDMSASADVVLVFEHWRRVMSKPTAKLTKGRAARVRDRLREGYTVEQLQRAVDGCKASAFHQGQNDRGTTYNDLELICRSGEKVEQFSGPPDGRRPVANPKAEQRQAGMEALIRGGLKGDQRSLGARAGGSAGLLPATGHDGGGSDAPGQGVPGSARRPDR